MRQRRNKFLVMPGASFAQHGHVDQSTDVPVPQRQGRVHLRGRERLCLLNQSRHLLYEFATLGADRLRESTERSQVRVRRWLHQETLTNRFG